MCVFLLFCFAVQSVTAVTLSAIPGTRKFSATLAQSGYVTIKRLSLTECIQYCDVRVKCKSVTYRRLATECELHEQGLTTADDSPAPTNRDRRAVLFAREDWDTKTGTCGTESCSGEQSCDSAATQACAVRECEKIAESVDTLRTFGNVQKSGATIVKVCHTGFIFPDGKYRKVLNCEVSGQWTSDPAQECEPVNCINVRNTTPMEYTSFDLDTQHVINIFCEFESNHGYTYISSDSIGFVKDLARFYTSTDHVMLRHRRNDGSQWEGKFSVIFRYSHRYNVTVLANAHTGFGGGSLTNVGIHPGFYIFAGLVPDSFGSKENTQQGYAFEGTDVEYNNCDLNRNNYVVVSVNVPTGGTSESCGNNPVACTWVKAASRSGHDLPSSYFYQYALMMGGCGIGLSEVVLNGVPLTGATIGVRFDL